MYDILIPSFAIRDGLFNCAIISFSLCSGATKYSDIFSESGIVSAISVRRRIPEYIDVLFSTS